ncbi:MAG: endonuclease III [Sulfobacillus sp.]
MPRLSSPIRRLPVILDLLAATYPHARCGLDFHTPFELLLATVLSAQCTDRRVNLVTARLFPKLQGPQSVVDMGEDQLAQEIRDVGLFQSKARSLVSLSMDLVDHHGGEVPAQREALEALAGVGKKTASVVLANAFSIPALAVDTHVFRVSHRLGLSTAKTADRTASDLMALVPEPRWIDLHHQLIWHGRLVCHARNPACASCPLCALCPEGRRRVSPSPSPVNL